MDIQQHNPSLASSAKRGIFGLPHTQESAEVILLPVPWDVSTTYHRGTSKGPEAILKASAQLDVYHPQAPELWKHAPFMLPVDTYWLEQNQQLGLQAQQIIASLEQGNKLTSHLQNQLDQINCIHQHLTLWVKEQAQSLIARQKTVGLIGGEHSVSLGLLQCLAESYDQFGILHIDAHLDLRSAYMGFTQSHASIMYNALSMKQVTKLVSVAVRDYCEDEIKLVKQSNKRIKLFTSMGINQRLFCGESWNAICEAIIETLPQQVYLSFDIDGLSPEYCPNTGTPVPGGISYNQAVYLIQKLANSGKHLIGFDLVEVAPTKDPNMHHDYDANVGARLIWELTACAYLSKRQQKESR